MKSALSLALLLAVPAAAQQAAPAVPTAYARAIAAGYKAAMLCSGVFVAGRTQAQVEATELKGIYPEYAAIVPTLPAEFDRFAQVVSVRYDPAMPPRHAEWRGTAGCTTLPIGVERHQPGHHHAPQASVAPLDPRPWPTGDAATVPALAPALATAVGRLFDGKSYGAGAATVGMVILHDGRIVAERYADGFGPTTANRTWSVGKSIVGTLVGLTLPDPLATVMGSADIPEWAGDRSVEPRRAITLDLLLRMGSGLHSDTAGNRTDAIYFGGTAVTEQATAWPLEAPPGRRFRYANNDILLAVRSLRATLGEERYRFLPHDALFAPLGMTHTTAERDWRGNYVLSSQVWSTARDLARLGQFWLQDGVWNGKRLLPRGWMAYMTTPAAAQPESGPRYGATMWLFGPAHGLPEGSYAAQGNRGQYVMVIPSRGLVIVRRGEDPGAARFDIAKFSADVIAAIR